MVYFVYLVYLVSVVQANKLNKPNNGLPTPTAFLSILLPTALWKVKAQVEAEKKESNFHSTLTLTSTSACIRNCDALHDCVILHLRQPVHA